MMRYPSELLRMLADRVDVAEDWVLERDWRFWRWAEATAELEQVRQQLVAVVEDYSALAEAYREKTGEPTPEPSPITYYVIRNYATLKAIRQLRSRWGGLLSALGRRVDNP